MGSQSPSLTGQKADPGRVIVKQKSMPDIGMKGNNGHP